MNFIESFNNYLKESFPEITFSIGEIERDVEGIYIVQMQAPRPPDQDTGVFYESVSLWSLHKQASVSLSRIEEIYEYLHQLKHYEIEDYYVFWTQADSRPEDGDRTPEGMKITRLPIMLVVGKRST